MMPVTPILSLFTLSIKHYLLVKKPTKPHFFIPPYPNYQSKGREWNDQMTLLGARWGKSKKRKGRWGFLMGSTRSYRLPLEWKLLVRPNCILVGNVFWYFPLDFIFKNKHVWLFTRRVGLEVIVKPFHILLYPTVYNCHLNILLISLFLFLYTPYMHI